MIGYVSQIEHWRLDDGSRAIACPPDKVAKRLAMDIVSPVSGRNERRHGLLWTTGLVAVAIAGLLVMHGFEGAALTFTDQGQSTRHQTRSPESHGAVGLCVFVVSMAGIGLAGARLRRRRLSFVAPLGEMFLPSRCPSWSAPAGRSLLIDLSVLRL